MSLFGKKGYLRVTTPQTIDGTTLRYDEENGERVVKKETHLPLTAKKYMDAENENLPNHLKHKIEVVPGEEDDAPKRGKPGPKPKASE